MLIREATKEDHDAILILMQYLHPNDSKVSRSVSLAKFIEILESDYFVITVAEKSNSVVGSCYINIIPNLTRDVAPYCLIENVVTHLDFRRQGVGQALINHALNYARSRDCYKAMLLTGRDKEVQEFYQACGMYSGSKTAFVTRWYQD